MALHQREHVGVAAVNQRSGGQIFTKILVGKGINARLRLDKKTAALVGHDQKAVRPPTIFGKINISLILTKHLLNYVICHRSIISFLSSKRKADSINSIFLVRRSASQPTYAIIASNSSQPREEINRE